MNPLNELTPVCTLCKVTLTEGPSGFDRKPHLYRVPLLLCEGCAIRLDLGRGNGMNSNATEQLVVPAKEAAQMFGMSRTHWLELNNSGRCPAPIKLGRKVFWNRHELKDWLAAGCPTRERWENLRKSVGRVGGKA